MVAVDVRIDDVFDWLVTHAPHGSRDLVEELRIGIVDQEYSLGARQHEQVAARAIHLVKATPQIGRLDLDLREVDRLLGRDGHSTERDGEGSQKTWH